MCAIFVGRILNVREIMRVLQYPVADLNGTANGMFHVGIGGNHSTNAMARTPLGK